MDHFTKINFLSYTHNNQQLLMSRIYTYIHETYA